MDPESLATGLHSKAQYCYGNRDLQCWGPGRRASHSPWRVYERHCLGSVYNTSVAHLTPSGLVSNSNYEDSVFFIIFWRLSMVLCMQYLTSAISCCLHPVALTAPSQYFHLCSLWVQSSSCLWTTSTDDAVREPMDKGSSLCFPRRAILRRSYQQTLISDILSGNHS